MVWYGMVDVSVTDTWPPKRPGSASDTCELLPKNYDKHRTCVLVQACAPLGPGAIEDPRFWANFREAASKK